MSHLCVPIAHIQYGVEQIEVDPGLILEPPGMDFGPVPRGEQINGTATLTSAAEDPLDIILISGCSCLEVFPPSLHLEPGETADFSWSFDTSDYRGAVVFDVVVATGPATVQYSISGIVISPGLPLGLIISLSLATVIVVVVLLVVSVSNLSFSS